MKQNSLKHSLTQKVIAVWPWKWAMYYMVVRAELRLRLWGDDDGDDLKVVTTTAVSHVIH